MSKFEIYPVIQDAAGQWSVPDEVLIGIWDQIYSENKVQDLFYDGSIKSVFDWINFIKGKDKFPILVVNIENKSVVHIAWLKDVFDIGAWLHHCSVGLYQRGAWEAARDYWKNNFKNLKLLMGITPETNIQALKILTKIAKFTVVGAIPMMCNMAFLGKRVPGIISYYQLQPEE